MSCFERVLAQGECRSFWQAMQLSQSLECVQEMLCLFGLWQRPDKHAYQYLHILHEGPFYRKSAQFMLNNSATCY